MISDMGENKFGKAYKYIKNTAKIQKSIIEKSFNRDKRKNNIIIKTLNKYPPIVPARNHIFFFLPQNHAEINKPAVSSTDSVILSAVSSPADPAGYVKKKPISNIKIYTPRAKSALKRNFFIYIDPIPKIFRKRR